MPAMGESYQWDVHNVRGYANRMGVYKTRREWAFIKKHIGRDRQKVLDIGGGSGRFAVPLAAHGHAVTVVDVSPEALRLLARAQSRVRGILADFMTLDDRVGEHDAAIAIETVQSFVDSELPRVFAKVASLLRRGAPFVFTGLNRASWRYRLHELRPEPGAFNVSDVAGFTSALQRSGFDVVEVAGFMWMPFGVTSNSAGVPAAALVERALLLSRWTRQSPWLLIAAKRM
jgi:SAM-dependent methyltransferase